MGIPSVSDGIRGRLEEEHRRLDAAGDLLSREALDGNYKRERRGELFGPSHADATTKTRRPAGATRLRRLRPMSACQSCFGKSLGFLSFTASPVRTFLSPISSL